MAATGDPGDNHTPPAADARVARSRARIVEAAIELIVEDGASALTVDAIAKRSGVAKSTLYRHWRSVDDVLLEVFRSSMPPTFELDPEIGFEDALRQQMAAVARSLADPRYARLLPDLIALRSQHPKINELAELDLANKEATLAATLATGAAQGLIPADLDIRTVEATLIGPMMTCALFGEPDRIEEAGRFALDRFLDSYRRWPASQR
jgi:AcrR family transcriptional regulator